MTFLRPSSQWNWLPKVSRLHGATVPFTDCVLCMACTHLNSRGLSPACVVTIDQLWMGPTSKTLCYQWADPQPWVALSKFGLTCPLLALGSHGVFPYSLPSLIYQSYKFFMLNPPHPRPGFYLLIGSCLIHAALSTHRGLASPWSKLYCHGQVPAVGRRKSLEVTWLLFKACVWEEVHTAPEDITLVTVSPGPHHRGAGKYS